MKIVFITGGVMSSLGKGVTSASLGMLLKKMCIRDSVGINWGDEGKGRMVDYLSESYEVVVRYQGGNNAGHTVINEFGKFALNLLPSGIFRPGTINILGPGTVIDLEHLCGEIGRLQKAGVSISPENLYISDRAMICMPFHRWQDQMEEDRLGACLLYTSGCRPSGAGLYQPESADGGKTGRPCAATVGRPHSTAADRHPYGHQGQPMHKRH